MAAELKAIQDRVRLLIQHWPTDGRFKETVLRNLLRKHLPESVLIGTGFVVSAREASGEIDILIVDRGMPTLFKEDDLLIVTPESVRAVIEVKTSINSPGEIRNIIQELALRKQVAASHVSNTNIWAGLFVYDADEKDRHQDLLSAVCEAGIDEARTIDCVAFGRDTLVNYFGERMSRYGVRPDNAWHSFQVPSIAPAMFVASLIGHLMPNNKDFGSFAWEMLPEDGERRFVLVNKLDETIHRYDEWLVNNPKKMPFGMDEWRTHIDDPAEDGDLP